MLVEYLERLERSVRDEVYLLGRIRQQPTSALWHYRYALLLMRREQYSTAVDPLRTALKLLSDSGRSDPAVESDYIRALARAKRNGEAIEYFERREQAMKGASPPQLRITVAEAYLMDNKAPRAAEELKRAVAQIVSEAGAEGMQPVAIGETGRLLGLPNTVALCKAVAAERPDAPGVTALQVRIAGMLSEAPDAALRAEGRALLDAILPKVVQGSPAHLEALFLLGRYAELEGKGDASRAAYEEILRYDRDNLRALNNLAFGMAVTFNDPTGALPYAERLIAVKNRMSEMGVLAPELEVAVLDTVGWVYHLNGRSAQAESLLSEAVRIQPDHVESRRHLAKVLAAQGRRPEARRMLETARDAAAKQKNQSLQNELEKEIGELR
jgi:tetratricopeptide (TPR) repeat protein